MNKRTAAAALCILLAASLCACGGQSQQAGQGAAENAAEQTDGEAESAEVSREAETEQDTGEEPAAGAEPSPQEDPAALAPAWTVEEHVISETREDILLAEGSYDSILLTEETTAPYVQLQIALQERSEDIRNRAETQYGEILQSAESFLKDYDGAAESFPSGAVRARVEVTRCDADVLSFLETWYVNHPGAAHGLVSYRCCNLDTAGEPLVLRDLVADVPALKQAISEHLAAEADGSPVTGVDDLLAVYFENDMEELIWTIGEEGITFHFAPYELAAYAVGPVTAEIPFEEYPELFIRAWE